MVSIIIDMSLPLEVVLRGGPFMCTTRRVGLSTRPILTDHSSIAIKELVADANFECNEEGIVRCIICVMVRYLLTLRFVLDSPGNGQLSRSPRCCEAGVNRVQEVPVCLFLHFLFIIIILCLRSRCDRPMPLGVNLTSLTKVLKCAKDDDTCTLKASDDGDILSFVYEARSTYH